MIAPTPSEVRATGPKTRFSRLSPAASFSKTSSDFLANNCLQNMNYLMNQGFSTEPAAEPGATTCRGIIHERPRESKDRQTRVYSNSDQGLSRISVTGPSLTNSTCISAPKRPVAVGTPRALMAFTKAS